jgi:hypothetical protein
MVKNKEELEAFYKRQQEIDEWFETFMDSLTDEEYEWVDKELDKVWVSTLDSMNAEEIRGIAMYFYKLGKESLTWQDIREIVQNADNMLDDPEARIAYQNHNEEYYYKKVLESWKGKCHL